ncbi:YgjV family protein [Shewanella sp. UCD-KL12]|uniref:YgjV family protein n=1 Tax=Shewanella sp. UCD-KL12 TaxID=1917163 RepID=UPI0009704744|nr:YgjV family protein [Shewanella sp. UCD-KL12]
MSAFVLSQWLVAAAIVFDLISFQFKHKQQIVACLCISAVLISSHFYLLEQLTAACLMLLAALRYLVTIFSHSKRIMWVFISVSAITSLFTYTGWLSVISLVGSTIQTRAAFCQSDQNLRLLMIIGTCVWLLNNALAGSPMGVLMEVLFIASNLVGYYRHYGLALPIRQ